MTSGSKHQIYILLLVFTLIIVACKKQEEDDEPVLIIEETQQNSYSVNQNFILKNQIPLNIKGVVYVPAYPGYLPWDLEEANSLPQKLKNHILNDIVNIKAMGANTIRFWGAPSYCYEALKNVGELNFIQTIWFNGDVPDFQDPVFKENSKEYIRKVVDRIYSVYPNNDPPVIAFLVGNELSEASIKSTNAAHPSITSFDGNYIHTEGVINASEAFIAEMADYLKSYENAYYGKISLVSYANDIRTADLIDTPFLDFRSHNAYSYAIPYYRPNTPQGNQSSTLFQGWVEELKAVYPNKPLLITETGLSVSPNAQRIGPPNYGYGGNTVEEQKIGLLQNLNDLNTAVKPIAGVCIHEYLDAWWKFSLEDSYSQDPNDVEEWFGLTKFIEEGSDCRTEFRDSYHAIKQLWLE